jgi:hypothetical protein
VWLTKQVELNVRRVNGNDDRTTGGFSTFRGGFWRF